MALGFGDAAGFGVGAGVVVRAGATDGAGVGVGRGVDAGATDGTMVGAGDPWESLAAGWSLGPDGPSELGTGCESAPSVAPLRSKPTGR